MKPAQCVKTLLPVAIMLFLALQEGSGFLIVILLPFFLMTVMYSFVQMIRKPDRRRTRIVRLAVWSVAFAAAGGLQAYRGAASHKGAELALKNVMVHRERVGTYPGNLNEAGLDEKSLKEKTGVRYSLKEGKPSLAYPAAFMPLTMHQYDFETGRWRQNAY